LQASAGQIAPGLVGGAGTAQGSPFYPNPAGSSSNPFAKSAALGYSTTSIRRSPGNCARVSPAVRVPYSGSGGHNVAEINEIEQKVIDIVAEQMGVDKAEITRDTSFINDLNADSLDTVELVMEFEDEFEMSIPDEEAEKIQTVGQAIDYIKSVADKQGPKE
jgi:acyl carrier protein